MAKAKFDKEKWLEEKNEKLSSMENEVKSIVENFKTNPVHIAELLEFKTKFHDYSLNNCMLIQKYNPYITFVASFKDWKDKFGYTINKGEKGLPIFYPAFANVFQDEEGKQKYAKYATTQEKEKIKNGIIQVKKVISHFDIGYVFDIAQTNCPTQDYPKIYSMGKPSETHNERYEQLKAYAESLNIKVEEKDLKSIALRGTHNPLNHDININGLLNDTQKLSTLTHELGHAFMQKTLDPIETSIKEFEADCLSIMFEQYFNIEINDARKMHLVDHYNNLPLDFDIMSSLKKVEKIFNQVEKEYETFISKREQIFDINKSKYNEIINLYINESEFLNSDDFKDLDKRTQRNILSEKLIQIEKCGKDEIFVEVVWSESNKLKDGQILSLSYIDAIFEDIDTSTKKFYEQNNQVGHYDKTMFKIYYKDCRHSEELGKSIYSFERERYDFADCTHKSLSNYLSQFPSFCCSMEEQLFHTQEKQQNKQHHLSR